jgi:hypothetical protein
MPLLSTMQIFSWMFFSQLQTNNSRCLKELKDDNNIFDFCYQVLKDHEVWRWSFVGNFFCLRWLERKKGEIRLVCVAHKCIHRANTLNWRQLACLHDCYLVAFVMLRWSSQRERKRDVCVCVCKRERGGGERRMMNFKVRISVIHMNHSNKSLV